MLEARVASLEADVKNIRENVGDMKSVLKDAGKDLTDLKVSHATLTERIIHLPTKSYFGWWITGGLTIAVAALTMLSRLGFLVAVAPK